MYVSQTASENVIGELFSAIAIAAKGDVIIVGDINYPGKHWIVIHLVQPSEIYFLTVIFISMLRF